MTLGAYMAAVTHRQHAAYTAWLDLEMDRPDRSDHYRMAILAALYCMPAWVWGKEATPEPNRFRIRFERADAEQADESESPPDEDPYWGQWKVPKRLTAEEVAEFEKRRTLRRLNRQIKARG